MICGSLPRLRRTSCFSSLAISLKQALHMTSLRARNGSYQAVCGNHQCRAYLRHLGWRNNPYQKAFANSESPPMRRWLKFHTCFQNFPAAPGSLPLGKTQNHCYIMHNVEIEAPCLRPHRFARRHKDKNLEEPRRAHRRNGASRGVRWTIGSFTSPESDR